MKSWTSKLFLALSIMLVAYSRLLAAETVEQLIAGAKKESELTFIAGAQTFGGAKTLAALEAAFNKRFGLNARIRFAAPRFRPPRLAPFRTRDCRGRSRPD